MSKSDFDKLVAPYNQNIVIDLGTGDGLFVYHSAGADSSRFFIGIDPNVKPLQKVSQMTLRKFPNALYLRASVEDLPDELAGKAAKVHIHFPWGSLLGAVLGRNHGLTEIRKLCAPVSNLETIFSLQLSRDRSELLRLGIDFTSFQNLEKQLQTAYSQAGFHLQLHNLEDIREVQTSWARRLNQNSGRHAGEAPLQNNQRRFYKIKAQPFSKG